MPGNAHRGEPVCRGCRNRRACEASLILWYYRRPERYATPNSNGAVPDIASSMKQYLALAAIVFAGIIPFSSRAVFMDEHIFLKIAQNAQQNWSFPQDVSSVFFGVPTANFAAHTHPPR